MAIPTPKVVFAGGPALPEFWSRTLTEATSQKVIGRFYALPAARRFELHPVAAGVLSGHIAANLPAAQFAPFNGTGVLCSCLVEGSPLTLLAIDGLPSCSTADSTKEMDK